MRDEFEFFSECFYGVFGKCHVCENGMRKRWPLIMVLKLNDDFQMKDSQKSFMDIHSNESSYHVGFPYVFAFRLTLTCRLSLLAIPCLSFRGFPQIVSTLSQLMQMVFGLFNAVYHFSGKYSILLQ